ncbi:MAG: preprotein translocase subunit SecG [Lentisphaeria bacterium]
MTVSSFSVISDLLNKESALYSLVICFAGLRTGFGFGLLLYGQHILESENMVTFFTVLLTILAILSGILMVVVIMLQNNKGGGGLGAVSGGITETMFGASAGNVLVKITIWLAAIFMGSTLLLATMTGRVRSRKSVAETYVPAAEGEMVQPIDVIPATAEAPATNAEQVADAAVAEESKNAAEKVETTVPKTAETEKEEVLPVEK